MKQVIVTRTDLDLTTGKLCGQVAHASIMSLMKTPPIDQDSWFKNNQPKIILKIDTLEELVRLYETALNKDIPTSLVIDVGMTQIKPGTITCIGIGPAPKEKIDELTSTLKLL